MNVKKVILQPTGQAAVCTQPNCFEWVFTKREDGALFCQRCGHFPTLTEGQTEGEFPRPGREYWDRINQLPRWSFWLANGGVKRTQNTTGKWFEADVACALMEEAQNEINQLRARLALLEPKGVPNHE
jgi:hypothetical protein